MEVRVNGCDKTLKMAEGQGHVDLPAGAAYTLDPHSKLLRELPHIREFQADKEAREKAEKDKAGKAAKKQ
ncbi:hypothetical protein [Lysobacter sp. CFH 32150]|uniref:hypothetical protein n=1 Tax=Lysobacter sp. CFH 32150 TaxID=2927128 RepID=UPI001FA7473F|nr:hypothetical protein [Lysobacter sp. CFH 32150]MCI4566594.1 hypothetical protein [Lysobacter sp. CFH 32150]